MHYDPISSKLLDVGARTFAEEILKTVNRDSSALSEVARIAPLKEEEPSQGGGSSDVGDVSWNVPTVSFTTATFIPGSAGHSWQNVASDGTTIGTKSLINSAKVFALSAIELYTNPSYIEEVKEEFDKRRGNEFKYDPLLGDRKPALDYRVR
jgi:aminobenzoyl-glutamate utilization protein B